MMVWAGPSSDQVEGAPDVGIEKRALTPTSSYQTLTKNTVLDAFRNSQFLMPSEIHKLERKLQAA